jgi:multidrug resistance efflux pump
LIFALKVNPMAVQTHQQPTSSSLPPTVTRSGAELPPIDAQIDRLANIDQDFRESYAQLFTLLRSNLDALWGLLEIMVSGRTVSREYNPREKLDSEALVDMAYALSLEAQMDSVSRAKLIPGQSSNYAVISCPIMDLDARCVAGTITLFVSVQGKDDAGEKLGYLENALTRFSQQMSTQSVAAGTASQTPATAEPPAELAAIIKATQCEDLRGLCFSLVNGYCQKFGCTKTSIGIVENNRTRVYAISGMDTLIENSPAVIDIQQSQDECLDYGSPIVVQKSDRIDLPPSDGFLIHQKWHQNTAAAAVASVPIKVDGEIIAVFSLERSVENPFEAAELAQVEKSIQTFGPAITMMVKSSLSLRQIAKEKAKRLLLRPFENRVTSLCVIAGLAFIILGWLPYRPTIPCTIEPANVNHVVAPFDGILASAPLFAGDEIKKGQVLLKLDTRELEMEQQSVAAQIRAKEVARNAAMAERKKSEASVLDAEVEALRVEQNIVRKKIQFASLRSRMDGTIIRGDMREQLGQVVSKGTELLQVAPTDGMKIQIKIPESQANLVKTGHEGYFAASSNPSDRHRFKITKITPSTQLINGSNVVMAEAEISGQADWMRSGMSGYAKVRTGWQPVWWILGHRVFEGLKLRFWL